MSPTLSVVQSCYNHAPYVGQSIRAILDQSFEDLELILLDDGSTDASWEVAEEAIDGDPRVTHIQGVVNRGMVNGYEYSRSLARGEFIALNACDDIVLPGWAEKSIEALRDYPRAAGTYALAGVLNPEGTLYHEMSLTFGPERQFWDPNTFADTMYGEHWVGNAAVYRTAMYAAAVPTLAQMESLRWEMDSFMGGVLGCRHGCVYLSDRLAAIRLGIGNLGMGATEYQKQEKVILAELDLLTSPAYADVLPCWIQGGLLSGKPHLVQIGIQNWASLSTEGKMLLQGAIWEEKMKTRMQRWQQPARQNIPVKELNYASN